MTDGLKDAHRKAIIAVLAANERVERAVLFGARATGTNTVTSDVDIALFGNRLTLTDKARLAAAIDELPMAQSLDLLLYNSMSDRTLREHIRKHGVEWFARSNRPDVEAAISSTPSDWQQVNLGDVVRLVSGGTPSKKREDYWHGTIPWVSARDMKQFRLRDTTHHITAEGLANGTKRVRAGTLLLLTRGMRLLKELPICVTKKPMAFNQDVKALLPTDRVDAPFLPYLVLGNKQRLLSLVDLAGHGTGRINSDELRTFDIRLPPRREQQAIAHILGTLDDKIELNRRMNETLEAIARALFKSWFVDFDPVRAKIEGRDTGLPRDIADLFPDRLVDSEMGGIPEGWEVSEIGKEVRAVGGSTPSTKEPSFWRDGRYHWATPKDLSKLRSPVLLNTSRKITDAGLRKISSGMLPIGTVLMSSRAPIGYLAIAEVPTAVNQGFIAMRCERRLPNLYVLCWCRENLVRIRDIAGGSTFPEISKKAFRPISVVVPSEAVLGMYERLGRPLHDQLVVAMKEGATLTALRDTLVPKLISGRIRLTEAKSAMVAEA
ncbi:restriction endonuclease subunit S [Candidatus Palauibacter sp.]|uniref:restriction endonuclease subunit S n=1 Tax=Candidatus Palauibacter sp. TaxID=3101350 RepID=UPI003B014B76